MGYRVPPPPPTIWGLPLVVDPAMAAPAAVTFRAMTRADAVVILAAQMERCAFCGRERYIQLDRSCDGCGATEFREVSVA